MLAKIAQGKYSQQEYAVVILPPQETELKLLSLEALVKLMENIVNWARLSTNSNTVTSGSATDSVGVAV